MHTYEVDVRWTGNRGTGTSGYRDYGRDSDITGGAKQAIAGSADPAFRGDADRWNPEELLVAAVAQCHLLWFLHLAAVAGVVVTDYRDAPVGTASMKPDGTGQFEEVVLRPQVTVAEPSMADRVSGLHDAAHEKCLIASSVTFPVRHEPTVVAS